MEKLSIDAVFVLSVRTFEDRIKHVKQQMALHQIPYQFIFEFDIPELNTELLLNTFETENVWNSVNPEPLDLSYMNFPFVFYRGWMVNNCFFCMSWQAFLVNRR